MIGGNPNVTEPGPLVIIGGHENKGRDPDILQRVMDMAGGRDAVIGVVPTASSDEVGMARLYAEVFSALGAERIERFMLADRSAADNPGLAQGLDRVTGVFFTGGDQLRITSTLGGTFFHRYLKKRHQAGAVVAGTSAGASIMSATMIVGGDAEATPARNTVQMAAGMGFWSGAVVDQHFSERGRIGRLLSALAQNPSVLGVGIDENTAIEVNLSTESFRVWGQSTVTVLDGQQVLATNASESEPDQPLALSHVLLHVLPKGWAYSWRQRAPIAAESP